MSLSRRSARALRVLGLVLAVVGALFGVPIVIDPPPRDATAESRSADGAAGDRKRRRRQR